MMKKICCISIASLLLCSINAKAEMSLDNISYDPNMNTTLVRIINQLNAILPLIEQAKAEQKSVMSLPTRFEFERYRTSDGVLHNGLKQDILTIRQALKKAINQTPLVPGYVKPLALDYTNTPSLKHHRAK